MKTLIIFLSAGIFLAAQDFKVIETKGDVKYQTGTEESWLKLVEGTLLNNEAAVSTGENSSVMLKGKDFRFTLQENSVVVIGSIKKMSIDELLLALAMEDLINVPKDNGSGTSDNTAVYGTEEAGKELSDLKPDDYGIKRLNGAIQLAASGLEESAVVFAKETYRKYPDTKSIPSYRIYFANVLYEKGLYEEALSEYTEISRLKLDEAQRDEMNSNIDDIKKIMMNN